MKVFKIASRPIRQIKTKICRLAVLLDFLPANYAIFFVVVLSGCSEIQMPPAVITNKVFSISFTDVLCGGNVTDYGNSPLLNVGVCWSESEEPTISENFTSDEIDESGFFLSQVTGLKRGRTYYIRAFAENGNGIGYGETLSFKTPLDVDELLAQAVINLTDTSATLNANREILSLTPTRVYFEYGQTNKYGKEMLISQNSLANKAEQNDGIKINGLLPGCTYHYRIKAVDIQDTIYGNDKTFTTLLRDADNNFYETVQIGNQSWMKENLRTTRFSNGDVISTTSSFSLDITDFNNPIYQWPCEVYESGRFYTYYTITDNRGVCPAGWHVPSDEEWTILTDYLSDNDYGFEGNSIKISKSLAAQSGWIDDMGPGSIGNDQKSNNKSGFTGVASGGRYSNGNIDFVGQHGIWWSSTESTEDKAFFRCIGYIRGEIFRGHFDKADGFPVRCVRTINSENSIEAQ